MPFQGYNHVLMVTRGCAEAAYHGRRSGLPAAPSALWFKKFTFKISVCGYLILRTSKCGPNIHFVTGFTLVMMNKLTKIIQILRIAFGAILTAFGVLGILLGILAIIDPAGTQMSDDADPQGTPPTFTFSLLITLFHLLITILGVSMIFGLKRLKNLFIGGPTTS